MGVTIQAQQDNSLTHKIRTTESNWRVMQVDSGAPKMSGHGVSSLSAPLSFPDGFTPGYLDAATQLYLYKERS